MNGVAKGFEVRVGDPPFADQSVSATISMPLISG